MPDKTSRRYLFVAIDRATRWVFMHIYGDMTKKSSVDFLRRLKLASPIKIAKILTDNGPQFTERFANKDKKSSGKHAFDVACAALPAEHRLVPPRHPRTNGMVERFNGRINELLQQTRFDSRADLETTLLNYLKLYNHHIPQRAIESKTPILALKESQKKRPELFVKPVYDHAGLDTYAPLQQRQQKRTTGPHFDFVFFAKLLRMTPIGSLEMICQEMQSVVEHSDEG